MRTIKVPDKTTMRRYLAKGMTQQQIADAWLDETGERVARSAIAMAIERYGLRSANPRPTYEELLPWTVAVEHRNHMDARMLRLEGRLRAGKSLNEQELRYLERWKEELAEANAVVYYDRDTDTGFWWVPRRPEHGDDLIDRSNAPRPDNPPPL